MDYIRLIIIGIIPVIVLATFLYMKDKYDKEPIGLLLKVFLFGAIVIIPVIFIELLLSAFNIFPGLLGIAFESFIIAGLIEEFFKRLIVLKFAYKNVAFNEKLDGIIYCAFASLGFAAIENIMYIFGNYVTNPNIGLYRGLFSVPAHMLFAVTMGYYIGLAKYTDDAKKKKIYFRKSLLYPILLHGTFNFILSTNLSFLFIFIPFVLFMWYINIKKINKLQKISKNAQ